jgi:hypothetical protein
MIRKRSWLWLAYTAAIQAQSELKKAECEATHSALSKVLVGVAGFELATPCTPCKCATRLRYTPKTNKKWCGWQELNPRPLGS